MILPKLQTSKACQIVANKGHSEPAPTSAPSTGCLGGQFGHWVAIGRHQETLHNAREMLRTATRVEKTPINIKKFFLVFERHEDATGQ
jgi:hypothetical protein